MGSELGRPMGGMMGGGMGPPVGGVEMGMGGDGMMKGAGSSYSRRWQAAMLGLLRANIMLTSLLSAEHRMG